MSLNPWTDAALPLLTAQDGVATSVQLTAAGVSATCLAQWVRSGRLVRLRRNVLVDGEVWRAAPPWDRHVIRARAIMHDREEQRRAARRGTGSVPVPGPLALSHHSALAQMGLAIHGVDDLVHVVGVGSTESRRRGSLVQHACVGPERIVDAFGLPSVAPAVACVQVAGEFGVEAGLVAADSALRRGLCTRAGLEALSGWAWLGRGRRAAATVVSRADGAHESAGESRTAWALHRLGYRDLRAQVVIGTQDGDVMARVDFLLEDWVVVEFDGMLKYADHGDLAAEKRREDRLRSLGYEVVRLTWADLADPVRIRGLIEAARARARSRHLTSAG